MTKAEKLQQMAVAMVMAELPETGAWDKLMDLEPTQPYPDCFSVWEPFENWEPVGLQDLASDFYITLEQASITTDDLPLVEQKYMDNQAQRCPDCDSSELEITETEQDVAQIDQHVTCENCGTEIVEHFQLTGVTI